jgi:hypothetical protein
MISAALDRMMEERNRPSNPAKSKRQVKLDGLVYVGDIRRHISAENKASICKGLGLSEAISKRWIHGLVRAYSLGTRVQIGVLQIGTRNRPV